MSSVASEQLRSTCEEKVHKIIAYWFRQSQVVNARNGIYFPEYLPHLVFNIFDKDTSGYLTIDKNQNLNFGLAIPALFSF